MLAKDAIRIEAPGIADTDELPSEPAGDYKPRIALVGINYAPELTGIGVYSAGLAEFLASQGHAVDVYTAFPYYPHWYKDAADRGRLYRFERCNGVNVRRHFLYVPRRQSALRRMLHELSFIVSVSIGYLFGPPADLTFVVSPPLPLGVPFALLAWFKGSEMVFHVQDLQPDAAIEFGLLRRGRFTDMLHWLERRTYALAGAVSTISGAMSSRIEGKGVPRSKLLLLPNWANDDRVSPRGRDTRFRYGWRLQNRLVVLYSGNLGAKQGLGMLLDCAARLTREDVVFVIVGDGGEKRALTERAQAAGLRNVQFHPLQSAEDLAELLATADIAVIPQRPGCSDIVLPSKLANILAARRPVIAAAEPGCELARMLGDADCGVVVSPGDADAMAAAIRRLAADPAERARLAANGLRYMRERLSRHAVLPGLRRAILARERKAA